VVLNSDNWYPVESLRRLRLADPPAIVGFARSALVERGNVAADRLERFGALEIDASGALVSIMPRPGGGMPGHNGESYASMNCWLFDSRIFAFCRNVRLSPRGEYELPRAVQDAVDAGEMRFSVLLEHAGVLDLSTRADVAAVQQKLAGLAVSY
jgi:glucose-1-phosphate thymidylyltransferase